MLIKRCHTAILNVVKSTTHRTMEGSKLFLNLDSIFEVLNKDQFKNTEAVVALKKIYNEEKTKLSGLGEHKRHPLIAIEGLDGTGKSTVTSKLAKKIGAHLCCTPPPCLDLIRPLFDDGLLRTAYYSLGNYIASYEITTILAKQPVVLDRFWHSTMAYAMAASIKGDELPAQGNQFYCWPEDLLKPDIVLFLNVSEAERIRRHEARNTTNTDQEKLIKSNSIFRKNILQAYMNMVNPNVVPIDADSPVEIVVEKLYTKSKHLLK